MHLIHLHADDDGMSHFADIPLDLSDGPNGSGVELLSAVQGLLLCEVPSGWTSGYHTAPRRQLVLQLSGSGEIVCSDGTSRVVGPGDLLLADDVTGQGHRSREISGPRSQAAIYLDPAFDLETLRRRPGS
jgi:hypothetical protein